MAASAAGETDRIIDAIDQLDQRMNVLMELVGEQARMLGILLELTVPDEKDEGPSLQALMGQLVTTTADNGVLLLRIHRHLEQQGLGLGRREG